MAEHESEIAAIAEELRELAAFVVEAQDENTAPTQRIDIGDVDPGLLNRAAEAIERDEYIPIVDAARDVVFAWVEYIPILHQYNSQHGHPALVPYGQKLWDALGKLHASFFEKPETDPNTEAADF